MKINNKEDYWKLVNNNWKDLFRILDKFLPLNDHITYDDKIIEESLAAHITTLKETKDINVVRYFQGAWNAAPDVSSIHKIPGWGILCDLCSEEWVLYEN